MIGPLLGAGASVITAIMGANAAKQQRDLDWMGLQETKRSNRKSEDLARSTKTDAYGNKLIYQPGVGWTYDLTDITEQIMSAEQGERRRNLLEDAPRERAADVRLDERSKLAGGEYERLFNEYKYRPQRSEAEEIGDSTDLLLKSRKKGLDEGSALLIRQMLRMGQGSNIESLYKSVGDQYAGSLEEAMLKGKQLGQDNFRNRRDSDDASARGELDFFRSIADKGGGKPAQYSSFNADLTGRGDRAQQELLRAIESGRDATARGYSQVADSQGRTGIDLSGLASALSGMDFGGGEDKDFYSDPFKFPPAPNNPGAQWWDPQWKDPYG